VFVVVNDFKISSDVINNSEITWYLQWTS